MNFSRLYSSIFRWVTGTELPISNKQGIRLLQKWRQVFAYGVIQGLIIAFLIVVYTGLTQWFREIIAFLQTFISQFWINLLGIIVLLVSGLLLFALRQRHRVLYGIFEVVFALIYGWFAINKTSGPEGYVESVSLVAAVYLVVRGLDNIYKGMVGDD